MRQRGEGAELLKALQFMVEFKADVGKIVRAALATQGAQVVLQQRAQGRQVRANAQCLAIVGRGCGLGAAAQQGVPGSEFGGI